MNVDDIRNKIFQGHAIQILSDYPDSCVDMCVTSPPYYGLRDYKCEPIVWGGNYDCNHEWGKEMISELSGGESGLVDSSGWRKFKSSHCFCKKCGAWEGQLGLEPSPYMYINHLCDIFDEIKRVLKDTGSCWVNLGDTYWGSMAGYGAKESSLTGFQKAPKEAGFYSSSSQKPPMVSKHSYLRKKSLVLIPFMFAIEMEKRGWILRNTLIWFKPNCTPSSIKDRFTVDFEYIFFFVKNNKPLFWVNEKSLLITDKKLEGKQGEENIDWEWKFCKRCDGIGINDKKEKCWKCNGDGRYKVSLWHSYDYYFEQQFDPYKLETIETADKVGNLGSVGGDKYVGKGFLTGDHKTTVKEHFGRNKRCVWKVPVKPYRGAHFAVYPSKLIKTPIQAACPEFICSKCGLPQIKVYTSKEVDADLDRRRVELGPGKDYGLFNYDCFLGNAKCSCNDEFVSGIVLDPFMGSGTTAAEAKAQRKDYTGVEINEEYFPLIDKRIREVDINEQSLF